jgi:Ion transport protein
MVRSGLFDNFLTLCVSTNVILLTLDKYPPDPAIEAVLAEFNTFFTYIFITEMSLKVIGLGPIRYLKDKMNYLDGTVVMLSIVEILMTKKGGGGSLSAFKSIRILRIFRILRVARLLRAMKSMQVILGVLMKSISSFIYLLLLIFLFVFIYSLLGM